MFFSWHLGRAFAAALAVRGSAAVGPARDQVCGTRLQQAARGRGDGDFSSTVSPPGPPLRWMNKLRDHAGWWFGAFFPYIGNSNTVIPTDFQIFQRGRYHQPGSEIIYFWLLELLRAIHVWCYGCTLQQTQTARRPCPWAKWRCWIWSQTLGADNDVWSWGMTYSQRNDDIGIFIGKVGFIYHYPMFFGWWTWLWITLI